MSLYFPRGGRSWGESSVSDSLEAIEIFEISFLRVHVIKRTTGRLEFQSYFALFQIDL